MLNFELSISILCGGRSKRFMGDKSLYMLEGKPIIKIIYDRFKSFSNDVFLQGIADEIVTGAKTYPDIIREKGPLGGIYSSLSHAKYDKLFVIACDMPSVDERILNELLKHREYEIVVPKWCSTGYYEPLCALYSKPLIPVIKELFKKAILKISVLYNNRSVRVKELDIDALIQENKIRKDCFKNINFPEDLS